MITDDQFAAYINKLSDSYEKIKDALYSSDLRIDSEDAKIIFDELSRFRDIACIALRDAHINKNFNQN